MKWNITNKKFDLGPDLVRCASTLIYGGVNLRRSEENSTRGYSYPSLSNFFEGIPRHNHLRVEFRLFAFGTWHANSDYLTLQMGESTVDLLGIQKPAEKYFVCNGLDVYMIKINQTISNINYQNQFSV